MDLLVFLIRSSRRMVLGTVVASALAGVFGAALIAVVHHALSDTTVRVGYLVAAFIAVSVLKIITQCASQIMLVRFAQDTILRLCRNLCDRVLAAPYERIEMLGGHRILASLTDDVGSLTNAVQAIPLLATNLAVIAGCGAYLAYLSLPMFATSTAVVLVGIFGYRLLVRRAQAAIKSARDGRDRLFRDFRTLIGGVKELKQNSSRREEFVRTELNETTEHLRRQNVEAARHHTIADAWSQLLFLVLIAILLFVAPALSMLNEKSVTGYVFASLYMMTPIWAIIGNVPVFMRGHLALERIQAIGSSLGDGAETARAPALIAPGEPVRIEFDGVKYEYPGADADEHGFAFGPVNMVLNSGELVFITGGNGSGKSTLAKLLTGLYSPHAGSIRLNGTPVTDETRESYRQIFTAVFADFHLFERLFGIDAGRREQEIQRYLAVLHMDSKVSVKEGRFSTTSLSTGQRKRLALLTAYLEDRAVYVFDEWAADQDPSYKEIFYMRLLPELRARGKCVVVITHDDRYFNRGDRVIKLEAGRAVEERRPVPATRTA